VTHHPTTPAQLLQLGVVLAILLVLTIVTVAVSYVDLGFFNVPVALTIACLKVTFVLLFFMHFKYEGPIIILSFIGTVVPFWSS
jgi:cytochrome c oxidase subunit IV